MIVYLELGDLDTFIKDLKSRGLVEVRKAILREVVRAYANLQVCFTSWDKIGGIILRLSVKYWTGPASWIIKPNKKIKEEIDKGYNEFCLPLEKKLKDSGLEVWEGQYQRE